MVSAAHFPAAPRARVGAGFGFALSSGAFAAAVAAAVYLLPLPLRFAAVAAAAFAALSVCVLVLAKRHLPGAQFGVANAVTLVRAGLVAPLVGLAFETPSAPAAWFAIALAIAGLVLDGVDGELARRFGSATPFGARFDMEVDALLILVLSVLCWQFDKAGAWILAAGLLRYAFVAGAYVAPALRRPLPPSRRRQGVCVAQIVALLLCLSPLLEHGASAAAGALGLAALAWSFTVDVVRLARSA